MLAKRSIKILRLLFENTFLPVAQIEKDLNLGKRTVRYNLDLINTYLVANKYGKIKRISGKGVSVIVEEEMQEKLFKNLFEEEMQNLIYDQKERIQIIGIVIYMEDLINIEQLSFRLNVSVSTIQKDIQKLKKELRSHHIKLRYDRSLGYVALGDELVIRNHFMQLIQSELSYLIGREQSEKYLDPFFSKEKIHQSFLLLEQIEAIEFINFNDDTRTKLLSYIYVMLVRYEKKYYLKETTDIQEKIISVSDVYKEIEKLDTYVEKNLGFHLGKSEVEFLSLYILGLNYTQTLNSNQQVYFEIVLRSFIDEVSQISKYDFSSNEQVYDSLMKHIEPMFYRLLLKMKVDNPLLIKVRTMYPDLYSAVKQASHVMYEFWGSNISDEEIGYLSMHFSIAMNQESQKSVTSKKVILICPSGVATSMMLLTTLQANYYIEVVKVLSLREIHSAVRSIEYDNIISTVKIDWLKLPYIVVNPILDFEDILMLNKLFVERFRVNDTSYEDIFKIIKDNCKINNEERLEKQLCELLKLTSTKSEKESGIMLQDIVNEDLIELQVDVKNWEDAIRAGGQLLVDNHIVKKQYIDAMIESAKKVGPYIVLEKGVAMPHAQPADNTHKVGVSIITLKHAVAFGHEENDPVSLVVCLATVDSTSHMQTLSDISKLLDDEEKIEKVMHAKSKKEVIDIIKQIA